MLSPASCLQKNAPLIPYAASVSHPTGPEPTMSGVRIFSKAPVSERF